MSDLESLTLEQTIKQLAAVQGNNQLAGMLSNIFHYTQFLLDDDSNLTRTGNLSSHARHLLHRRILMNLIFPFQDSY